MVTRVFTSWNLPSGNSKMGEEGSEDFGGYGSVVDDFDPTGDIGYNDSSEYEPTGEGYDTGPGADAGSESLDYYIDSAGDVRDGDGNLIWTAEEFAAMTEEEQDAVRAGSGGKGGGGGSPTNPEKIKRPNTTPSDPNKRNPTNPKFRPNTTGKNKPSGTSPFTGKIAGVPVTTWLLGAAGLVAVILIVKASRA